MCQTAVVDIHVKVALPAVLRVVFFTKANNTKMTFTILLTCPACRWCIYLQVTWASSCSV